MLCGGSMRRKNRRSEDDDEEEIYEPIYMNNVWPADRTRTGTRTGTGKLTPALVKASCSKCGDCNARPEIGKPTGIRRYSGSGDLRDVMGLENVGSSSLRPLNSDLNTPRIDSYRFSMANLEDSQDVDLDAILGELCALESQYDQAISSAPRATLKRVSVPAPSVQPSHAHARSNSDTSRIKLDDTDAMVKNEVARTESPDNDSAFSDTVSMLSSESSASSGGSGCRASKSSLASSSLAPSPTQMDQASRVKAEKIRIALEKMKEASVKKLFIKAFTSDGSTKSLLVDEKMTCAYVTRLLADKNHVQMDPKWGVVEHLPDLYMERVYEDHELLVENLMMWTRDSKNKLLFSERPDKTHLFTNPETFLLSHTDNGTADFDEHARAILLEEFFSSTGVGVPEVEGPLYLKADSKKGWKKHHFVLRASGLYYYPKEKAKSSRDLVCLATFDVNQVYYGVGWKKKYKSPTDFCFAVKHPRLQQPKSTKYIKFLCAEDKTTLHRWMMGIRLAKYGRHIIDNYRTLIDDIVQEDLELIAHARSCSVSSIMTPSSEEAPVLYQPYPYPSNQFDESRSDERSRASSSSSSGCLSDGISEAAFESDFPSGTIKRKPSMNPKLPLTSMTRQLKEVGETVGDGDIDRCNSPGSNSSGSGTLTRNGVLRPSRRRSTVTEDSGTLKRHHKRGSLDSTISRPPSTNSSNASTPVREQVVLTASPNKTESPSHTEAKLAATISALEAKLSAMTAEKNQAPEKKQAENKVSDAKIYSGRRWTPTGSLEKALSQTADKKIYAESNYQKPEPKALVLPPPLEDYEMEQLDSELLPPPPPEMFESTLSLDSLPPPPPPNELTIFSDHGGSSLSLMSLPPPPSPCISDCGTLRRMIRTPQSSASTTPTNVLSPATTPTKQRQHCFSPPQSPRSSTSPRVAPKPMLNRQGSLTRQTSAEGHIVPPYLAELKAGSPLSARKSSLKSPDYSTVGPKSPILLSKNRTKTMTKKISFNFTPEEIVDPPSPTYLRTHSLGERKPLPPKRSESTRLSATLSSPKKLTDVDSELTPPPKDFLKDLQRVMRKKWQVAQKCKSDTSTTPHEVLGFRDPPPPIADYRETNVSNWVQEHYGECIRDNLYENVYLVNQDPNNPAVQEAMYGTAVLRTQDANNRQSTNSIAMAIANKKRPPPLPPKRSDTTHLSTTRVQQ